jgi:hypothetical protein
VQRGGNDPFDHSSCQHADFLNFFQNRRDFQRFFD